MDRMHCDENYSAEALRARREYKREWNRKNADKVRAAQRRYWEKRARMIKEGRHEENASAENRRDSSVSEH